MCKIYLAEAFCHEYIKETIVRHPGSQLKISILLVHQFLTVFHNCTIDIGSFYDYVQFAHLVKT